MKISSILFAGLLAASASTSAQAVTLVSNQCFSVFGSQGCKFNDNINSQADATTLAGLYNGVNNAFTPNTDIELTLLQKIDYEGNGLAPFLSNIVTKPGEPNEVTSAKFTNASWIIDYYVVKAGNKGVLFSVGTPGDSFTFNTDSVGGKGVSHLVLFGRMNNDPNGIPEPATWAMMIGGFGLIGAAARRRRTGTALSAA